MIIALLWMIAFLILVKLHLQNSLDEYGKSYEENALKVEQLRSENSVIEEQILQAESLTAVFEKAKKAGFIPATEKNYVFLQSR